MKRSRLWREQEQAKKLEEGRALVRRWEESGQSAQEFCQAEEIKPQRLGYWRARLGGDGGNVAEPRFIPVRIKDTRSEGSLEVVLKSGRLVRVLGAVDGERVRAVIEAAEAAC